MSWKAIMWSLPVGVGLTLTALAAATLTVSTAVVGGGSCTTDPIYHANCNGHSIVHPTPKVATAQDWFVLPLDFALF
jgi:hypothetical protein